MLSVLGDGAYMFANPTACHYVAQMQNLPVLTVIYNNALYGAVRRATLDMYRQRSRRTGRRPPARRSAARRTSRRSSRRMTAMANASSGRPICRSPLRRAAAAVRGGQQALVNVICPP